MTSRRLLACYLLFLVVVWDHQPPEPAQPPRPESEWVELPDPDESEESRRWWLDELENDYP